MGEDPSASPYLPKIRKVVDFTFTHEGYRSDGAMYYTGTYNNGTISITDCKGPIFLRLLNAPGLRPFSQAKL